MSERQLTEDMAAIVAAAWEVVEWEVKHDGHLGPWKRLRRALEALEVEPEEAHYDAYCERGRTARGEWCVGCEHEDTCSVFDE